MPSESWFDSNTADSKKILFIDGETTTYNKGHPFDDSNILVSYAYESSLVGSVVFKYYTDADFISHLQWLFDNHDLVIGFNIKFDLHWFRKVGIKFPLHLKVWDCQIAEFIFSGQENVMPSLDNTLKQYDLPLKKDIVKEYWEAGIQTYDIPIEILNEYNCGDITSTKLLYQLQQQLLSKKQQNLVLLEGADLLALQEAEFNGFKFDYDRAADYLSTAKHEIQTIESELIGFLPKELSPQLFNFDSVDHLSVFLYGGTMVFDVATPYTAIIKSGPNKGEEVTKNRWSTLTVNFQQFLKPNPDHELKKTKELADKDVPNNTRLYSASLSTLKKYNPGNQNAKKIIKLLFVRSAKKKVVEMIESMFNITSTKNWTDGCIHGQFNQTVAVTGRLSSSAPNLQNAPPEIDHFFVSRYAD